MIEYQYYVNHRDYHDSMIDSNLQSPLADHNINAINYDNIFNSNTNISSESPIINYDQDDLFSDTLLSDNELDIIKEIFDDSSFVTSVTPHSISSMSSIPVVDSTKHKNRTKSLEVSNNITTSNHQQLQQLQQERTLLILKRNFDDFQKKIQTYMLYNNVNQLSLKIHQILHPKCLVRFKLTNISARSGPKSLINYLGLFKTAFPDGQKAFSKDKLFAADGYYIYKKKFVFNGTESSFEDTFNFFSYCCHINDVRYLIDRKDTFVRQLCLKINATCYIDPLTFKVVLCDIGLHIVNQKSIK